MKLQTVNIIFYIILSTQSTTALLRHQKLKAKTKPSGPFKHYKKSVNLSQQFRYGDFMDVVFKGQWQASTQMQNDFIDSNKGMIFLAFSYDYFEKDKLFFFFEIYEGFYREEKFLTSQIKFEVNQENIKEFNIDNKEIKIRNFQNFDMLQDTRICDFQLKIDFKDLQGQKVDITYDYYYNLIISGEIYSEKCNIKFDFNSQYEQIDVISVIAFVIINVWAIVMGIIPFYQMIKNNDFSKLRYIDENVLLANINIDFIHISVITAFSMRIVVNYFEFMSVVTIYLMLSMIIKMRAFVTNFYLKMLDDNLDQQQQRQKRFKFMLKFIIFSILAVTLSFFFTIKYYWFLIVFSYPLIQIIFNSCNLTKKQCFDYKNYPLFFLPQIILPLTLRGFTFSFLDIKQDPTFVRYLITLSCFFIIIMMLQRLLNPAFFLPKILRPNFYEYERKTELLDTIDTTCCPICFEELSMCVSEDEKQNQKSLKFLQTPCGHSFHKECLSQWMDQKSLCPCCRSKLPPYNYQNNQFSEIQLIMEDLRMTLKQRQNAYFDQIEKMIKQKQTIYVKISVIGKNNTISHEASEPNTKLQVGYGKISLFEYGFCFGQFEDQYLELYGVDYQRSDGYMIIKHCTIRKNNEKSIAINERGKEQIEFGYNSGGDQVEIVFTEGNTVQLSLFYYNDKDEKIRYHWAKIEGDLRGTKKNYGQKFVLEIFQDDKGDMLPVFYK